MPKTKKGIKLLRKMRKTYGKKKGTSVFYASEKSGRIAGVHKKRRKRKYRSK